MNLPGHAGLPLGVVYCLGYALDAVRARGLVPPASSTSRLAGLWRRALAMPQSVRWLGLDLRLVFLGSMLPDIIDKPLSFFVLKELVSYSTRNIAHTLIFNALLLAVALALLLPGLGRRVAPLGLALGSMAHLLLDQMWFQPVILLWPFLGWQFPTGPATLGEWILAHLVRELLTPWEVTGGLVLLWFVLQLYLRRALFRFIRTGRTE